MSTPICLKIDVDTHEGMARGVPALLAALAQARLQATFFLALGPDRSGLAMYDLYRRIQSFRLGPEAELIATPVLIGGDADDLRWPGQSVALHQRLGDHGVLLGETNAAGADAIMQWLDGRL